MATIVILNTNNKEIEQTVASASKLASKTFVIEKGTKHQAVAKNVSHISLSGSDISASLRDVAMKADGKVVVISSDIALSDESVEKLCAAANTLNIGSAIAIFKAESGTIISCEEIEKSNLLSLLSMDNGIPFGAIITEKELLAELEESLEPNEAIAKIIIATLAGEKGIHTDLIELEVETPLLTAVTEMSTEAKAKILRKAVSSFNIEELFPNHSWDDHQEESAAACYHTLAASFIRLRDHDAAMECLALSDRLEDSPRSLALRGLIALGKGETLSAVANMVSSLQEYERRKKETEGHYVRFAPRNLEKINTSLQSGLHALNQRENDAAAEHFQEAVFNFDSFYEDCGLQMSKQ